jgi:hypothetical protein
MNPRTRRTALYAIGTIAILASANALAHSYAGLYDWAAGHRLTGWQAASWPAEIDVFLAIGELALYVAYLDGWPARQRIWPWAAAIVGLAVSVAGNIGHIQSQPGRPVILADRLTAATSPIAAFAGLAIGLLVLKMIRQQPGSRPQPPTAAAKPAALPAEAGWLSRLAAGNVRTVDRRQEPAGQRAASEPSLPWTGTVPNGTPAGRQPARPSADGQARSPSHPNVGGTGRQALVRDASLIYRTAASRGERVSQRMLASQLRSHGHRFSNRHLHAIAASAGVAPRTVA